MRRSFWKLVKEAKQKKDIMSRVAHKVPTQKFVRMTLVERLRWIGANPEHFESSLGQRIPQQVRTLVQRPQFEGFARLQQRGADVTLPIGILEGTIITEAFRPLFRHFFPGTLLPAIGQIAGFDILFQFMPSPLTNLYLTPYDGRLAPRHGWARFWQGQSYVVPLGRPTDRQRAMDGLLIAMNAGTPLSFAKYILLMAMVLFAKEMWERHRKERDTGTPLESAPALDDGEATSTLISPQTNDLGSGGSTGTSRGIRPGIGTDSAGLGVVRNAMLRHVGFERRYGWTSTNESLLRFSAHRAVNVHCDVCGYETVCSESHAKHTIFYIGLEQAYFPCPQCQERNHDALVVWSPCTVSIVYLDRLRAILLGVV